MPEAIGAFLVCGALIALFGFSGWFERAIGRIPISIASAMLAGVLVRFTGDILALSPPLIIEEAHIERIVETIRTALAGLE